ncbi:MAG: hypothetical protein O7C98_16010 [Planctomycetota bacterium]|nr:hypothetical protein [Planctomycetota bacterium]
MSQAQDHRTRRYFLRRSAALFALMHLPGLGCGKTQPTTSRDRPPEAASRGRFAHLKLHTHRLDEQRAFYSKTLGLPVVAESKQSFTIEAGGTTLEFEQASDQAAPFYHFAFNIPENKLAKAKQWLIPRCPLLRDSWTGADELFFEAWNAHATYFHDPAGNIVEFIARHTLQNARGGAFGVEDILYASEIGLVGDQEQLGEQIMGALGVRRYHHSPMFVGDEHGLFVLAPVGRPWIPERVKAAAVFPAEVTVAGHGRQSLECDGHPYRIRGNA